MGLASDVRKTAALVKKALRNRAVIAEVRRDERKSSPHPLHHFKVAVYFADGDVNMYQLRQWYAPLQELARAHPVVVMCRNATAARCVLSESELSVSYVPSVKNLETFIAHQDIRVVLYVNQNTRNFQMFRYGHRWHAFINHGESDKMYMTTNQFKAYDIALIAGQAARERLSRVLWDYDLDARTIEIGRPQADHYSGEVPYPSDERRVILYAPTWEGDRPSAHYGSLVSHGEALVGAVLADPRYRLVYRPHPRSGVVNPAHAAAHRRITAAIAAANARDRQAHHVHDSGPELGWQLRAADIAIVDISAMVYDRLASGRPLIITRPIDPAAIVDTHGYLSDCEWLDASHASDVLSECERLWDDPQASRKLEQWSQHYFGDTAPGAATARFEDAITRLVGDADRRLANDDEAAHLDEEFADVDVEGLPEDE